SMFPLCRRRFANRLANSIDRTRRPSRNTACLSKTMSKGSLLLHCSLTLNCRSHTITLPNRLASAALIGAAAITREKNQEGKMRLSRQSKTSRLIVFAAPAAFVVTTFAGLACAQAADNYAMVQAVVNPYYSTWPQAAKDASADFGISV